MAAALALSLDPFDSARAAGLRHVDPRVMPGLRRVRRGRAFAYVDPNGRPVRTSSELDRIRKLVIPPAWTDVWICPLADGHIQATGRDARGRLQYRYHARWREVRDATKYHKMIAFADALPRIRAAYERDLRLPGLAREKVIATAVRLLELTHIRVGNEEYARDNGSYGLTTLLDKHVRVHGSEVQFHFRGKSGKVHELSVRDPRIAKIVGRCSELPGHELFRYVAEDGTLHPIDSSDVNEYIRRVAGEEFTAKDFRTWAGTVLAAQTFRAMALAVAPCVAKKVATKGDAKRRAGQAAAPRRPGKKMLVECVRKVASHLGNTPAVCKRCYIHPAIIEAYLDGSLSGLRARDDEALVRAVLVRAARTTESDKLTRALRASLATTRKRANGRRAGLRLMPSAG